MIFFIFYCICQSQKSEVNLIILLILEDPSLHSILNYLCIHFGIFLHEITNVRIKRILSIGIGHDEDQATNDHSHSNCGGIVLSHQRKADCSFIADVGVIYSIHALDFGCIDGVHIWKGHLKYYLAFLIQRFLLRFDDNVDDLQIILKWESQSSEIYLLLIVS